MSNSVFREFPSSTATKLNSGNNADPAGKNVVIVLNKDGSVSVDQNALHSFLKDESGKTAVSVVRIQSPTPSLQEELRNGQTDEEVASDNDESFEGFEDDEEVDGDLSEGADDSGNKRQNSSQQRRKRDKEQTPHVRLTVEEYLAPEEAKRFASEILQYAGMTSALSLDIDYDFQRYVVQNDHCYTPLTSPSQKDGGQEGGSILNVASQSSNTTTTTSKSVLKGGPGVKKQSLLKTNVVRKTSSGREISDTKKTVVTVNVDLDDEGEDSDEQKGEEEEDDDEDFSPSESDNDRDSDLDYHVNDRGYTSKARRSARKTSLKLNSSRPPATIASGSLINRESGGGTTKGIKKRHSVGGREKSFEVGEDKAQAALPVILSPQAPSKSINVKPLLSGKTVPVIIPGTNQKQTQVVKVEKPIVQPIVPPVVLAVPTPPPVNSHKKEKDRQQEEALFSDMSSLFSTPDIIKKVNSIEQQQNQHLNKSEPPPLVLNKGFMNSMVVRKSTGGQDSNLIPPLSLPNTFELDLIDSIVKEELNESLGANEKSSVVDDHLDLNDESLLDGITGEEGLPEELLQHVAALVENKNLQEVIDKQVLGVEDPLTMMTSNLKPKPLPVEVKEKESPFVKLAQQKQLAKQSAAAAASLTAPRKEPIKIVRSDGRVITLPPIEAPTTRGAKRRAQSSTSSADTPTSAARVSPIPVTTVEIKPIIVTKPDTPIMSGDEAMEKIRRKSTTTSDRLLIDLKTPKGSNSRRASTTPSVAESDMDDNWNSEDDPDRLWCICQQPHNNRFMICCDKCEDWFHGKCVNITKAMGQQMEHEGIEWTCPNCLLKSVRPGNQQQAHLDRIGRQTASDRPGLSCLVCKKPARPNSIYCSDDCIRKHAQKTSGIANAAQEANDQGPKKIGVLKNKHDRVIVFNKETNLYLSGDKAPQLSNLKRWLQDNPQYEVVQPGSALAQAFKAKQAQLAQLSKDMALKKKRDAEKNPPVIKVQTKLKMGSNKEIVLIHPKTASQVKSSAGKNSPTTEKNVPIKVRKSSESATVKTPTSVASRSNFEPEPIRVNVRRTFKEQLIARTKELTESGPRLTEDEIAQFSLELENEMFSLFNKDTGHKYKAKYRSLMFNIKDRKNQTLFQKICGKVIAPQKLVRMSPEELASQELAKWRENENKHQLEMITKSEMDMLATAKSFLMKTHKGEEMIENPFSDRTIENVGDITMLSVSNTSAHLDDCSVSDSMSSTKYDVTKSLSLSSMSHSNNKKDKKERRRSRSRDRDGHHRHSSSSSVSKHHKRKRSRERSRDKEKDKSRHKSSSSSHHGGSHHHSSSKDKKNSNIKSGGQKDKVMAQESTSSPALSSSSSQSKTNDSMKLVKPTTSSKKDDEEAINLIEKILKGTTPELIGKLDMDKTKTEQKPETVQEAAPSLKQDLKPEENDPEEYNPETAISSSPPIPVQKKVVFNGTLTMVDVASIGILGEPLSGESNGIQKYLPQVLDIVGRISPDTVWDYLYKIKRSPTKEIVLMRFSAKASDQQNLYESLFVYLEQKKRLGVIKTSSPYIKDFYILPLAESKSLPSVLLPLAGSGGFYDADNRPNLLIGIIVRIKTKRSSAVPPVSNQPPKMVKRNSVSASIKDDHFTPPSSPKSSIKTIKMLGLPKIATPSPLTPVQTKNDDDEPYSPGGSDDDTNTNATPMIVPPPAPALNPNDIQKKMEELNRQIEAQKQEIAVMLHQEIEGKSVGDKGSESGGSKMLANISIPSNLHEILETIKNVGQPGSGGGGEMQVEEEDDDDTDYTPIPGLGHPKGVPYTPAASATYRASSPSTMAFLLAQQQTKSSDEIPFISKSTSKISQMSEAELMSLVPDGVDIGTGSKKISEPLSEPPPPGLEEEYDRQ